MTTCNQHGCNEPAAYRFTWPGQDEAGICEVHAVKLRAIAAAIGLPLQLIRLVGKKEEATSASVEA